MNNCNNQIDSLSEIDNVVDNYLLIEGEKYSIPDVEQKIAILDGIAKKAKDDLRPAVEEQTLLKTYLREDSIIKQFEIFKSRQPKIVKEAVYLNKGLLRFVVKSYFDDILRYKDYSGAERANSHKQAAYTIKWITKFKPIQIKEEYDNPESFNEVILDINLIFALTSGFAFLDRKVIDFIAKEKKDIDNFNKSLSPEDIKDKAKLSFYNKLLYNLRYRSFTGKHLTSIFEALELCVNNSK